ncbi:hypothetical protein C8A03DRAFT_31833 [Achaetomium macrosporum]|uniref:Uncharacterized protein n=1 Tax=Achaetomium macrosporum TaxID=79813 RepID=A0AAN7CEY5_9PEZI|nr:hypothetical protein C8A03DRAFT_31833 [Achaetomium macrosporum]
MPGTSEINSLLHAQGENDARRGIKRQRTQSIDEGIGHQDRVRKRRVQAEFVAPEDVRVRVPKPGSTRVKIERTDLVEPKRLDLIDALAPDAVLEFAIHPVAAAHNRRIPVEPEDEDLSAQQGTVGRADGERAPSSIIPNGLPAIGSAFVSQEVVSPVRQLAAPEQPVNPCVSPRSPRTRIACGHGPLPPPPPPPSQFHFSSLPAPAAPRLASQRSIRERRARMERESRVRGLRYGAPAGQ